MEQHSCQTSALTRLTRIWEYNWAGWPSSEVLLQVDLSGGQRRKSWGRTAHCCGFGARPIPRMIPTSDGGTGSHRDGDRWWLVDWCCAVVCTVQYSPGPERSLARGVWFAICVIWSSLRLGFLELLRFLARCTHTQ